MFVYFKYLVVMDRSGGITPLLYENGVFAAFIPWTRNILPGSILAMQN